MSARIEGDRDRQNTVEPAKRRRNRAAEGARRADADAGPSTADPRSQERRGSSARDATHPSRVLPPDVWKRFIGIGTKYYFPDGAPAFEDRGTRLTTPSENAEVVRTLISIAQLRGWDGIQVRGSERFRKEAWFAAGRVGLEVRGYKASDVEKAQLARSLAKERGSMRPGSADREAQPQGSISRRAGPRREPQAAPRAHSTPAEVGVFVGRMLEHGPAPYHRDPSQQNSYFVRLATQDGEREIWGVDLEQAIRHSLSAAKVGDDVTVRAVGREPVSVPRKGLTHDGHASSDEPLATHRNRWRIERSDFIAARGRAAAVFKDEGITAQEGVKNYPELQGSYLKLQAAKLGAERDVKDVRERARLVTRARALIADSIERGDPLEPVRLRDPVGREQELRREPERSR
jgi:hypothetical protein